MPPIREVFRLGYKPDPWDFPDWKYISSTDGTFPNRYDDPQGKYRVLYASSQRLTCFLEILAPFRIAPEVAAGLLAIEGDPDDPYPVGVVSSAVFELRQMARATADISESSYADVCACEWIWRLRSKLLPHLSGLGIKSFDASTLLVTSPRRLTQLVSRVVYDSDLRVIRYPSKHGLDLENWAFLEPAIVHNPGVEEIRMDDPDLQQALKLLSLQLGR